MVVQISNIVFRPSGGSAMCDPDWISTGHRVARTGRFLADDLTGDLIRYEEEGHGFPKDYSMQQRNEIVAFEYVKIADAPYLLPVSAEFWWRYLSSKPRRVVITYKNYRHFEASTKIAFQ